MQKVILFGASGNLGRAIAQELISENYDLTVVIRSEAQASLFPNIKYQIADASKPETLIDICKNQDIIISAIGKSISASDFSKPSFYEIDWQANQNILFETQKSPIQKFIYISAFETEKYQHLAYFGSHYKFEESLKNSGINYSIIKPVAMFNAFNELLTMAQRGTLVNMGKGDKRTNPIFEGDLAKVVLESINKKNAVINVGGPKVYTRKELNEIVAKAVNVNSKVKNVPLALFNIPLFFLKFVSKNTYDKLAFFVEVVQHDIVAEKHGNTLFEDYIEQMNA